MNPDKFTQKTGEIINRARELALDSSQQTLGALHVALVLFEDAEGVAKQAVLKLGGESAYKSVLRVLNRAQQAQPRVDPAPEEVFLAADLKKAFSTAAKLQKDKGDSFLGEQRCWRRSRQGSKAARERERPSTGGGETRPAAALSRNKRRRGRKKT